MSLKIENPVFILAAPRSGSTLLFETLAVSGELWTIGGESHAIFERMVPLSPGSPGVTSNRLTAAHASGDIASRIAAAFLDKLRDASGQVPPSESGLTSVRLLEKTPKNSLRIPFIRKIFPGARFVYLYRDPHENISSIMEAWRSGGWVTYRNLTEWGGPWSLLLPPGWEKMKGRPLAEIAAFQWDSANSYILDDLSGLAADRWVMINYTDLVQSPVQEIKRICKAIDLSFDDSLKERATNALPMSRYTLTPPKKDKWKKNEQDILRVIPLLSHTLERLDQAARTHTITKADAVAKPFGKIHRNAPCPCGSGKKYKRCHGNS